MIREGKTADDVARMLITNFGWNPNGAGIRGVAALMAEVSALDLSPGVRLRRGLEGAGSVTACTSSKVTPGISSSSTRPSEMTQLPRVRDDGIYYPKAGDR